MPGGLSSLNEPFCRSGGTLRRCGLVMCLGRLPTRGAVTGFTVEGNGPHLEKQAEVTGAQVYHRDSSTLCTFHKGSELFRFGRHFKFDPPDLAIGIQQLDAVLAARAKYYGDQAHHSEFLLHLV